MDSIWKGCSDVPGGSCCGSCHDDADEGYGDLCEVYDDARGIVYSVCCAKSDAAHALAKPTPAPEGGRE